MTSRNFKLLATTAFIAVGSASAANAVTTVGTSGSYLYTSDTTGGFNISGTTTISSATGAAIEVSGTGAMVIQISSSAVVSSSAVSGTISGKVDSGVTGLTVNNSGTIVNYGANAAISSTQTVIPITVNNTGTISGTVNSGAGALTYTGTNGTQKGSITSTNSGGTDAVTLTGGTMTGNISLGNGTNNVTISNSTLTGNYTGGSGADTTTLTNATVVGNLDGGTTGGDGDVLTINGANSFTTQGTITNYETVNFNTNTTLNNALSNANTVTVGSGKTLTVNSSFAAGTGITNAGTMQIDAGKTVTTAGYTGTGGTLGLVLASSNTTSGIGKVVFNAGTTITTAPSVSIIVSSGSGFIASGTTYTVVDGNGGSAAAATILNSNTGVYRFSSVAAGNDINIVVGRVSTSSVVTGADAQGVANALDILGANATGSLATVQGVIGNQSTATGVNNVINSLTPGIEGAGAASVAVSVDTGNQISNRLASLRGTGVATGDAMANKHMWMQAFGSTVSQDDHKGAYGYDANSGGVSLGVDTDTLLNDTTTGLAVSYGHGTVDSNSTNNASTDIDTYMGTLYGSRVFNEGVFVNGQLGIGYNKYDMERTVIGVGKATGDTNGWQTSAKLEGGKDYAVAGMTLTPLASLQYTYLDMDSYTETGAGGASLRVNPKSLSTVDAGAGVNLAYAIPLTDGGTLKPSAHAKYIYRMGDTSMGTTSNFTGGGASFNTDGVKADRSSVNLGAGLLLTTVGGTDLSLNYDADIRSNLVGHTGQLKARWAF